MDNVRLIHRGGVMRVWAFFVYRVEEMEGEQEARTGKAADRKNRDA
jgi:hypothetical protein